MISYLGDECPNWPANYFCLKCGRTRSAHTAAGECCTGKPDGVLLSHKGPCPVHGGAALAKPKEGT